MAHQISADAAFDTTPEESHAATTATNANANSPSGSWKPSNQSQMSLEVIWLLDEVGLQVSKLNGLLTVLDSKLTQFSAKSLR